MVPSPAPRTSELSSRTYDSKGRPERSWYLKRQSSLDLIADNARNEDAAVIGATLCPGHLDPVAVDLPAFDRSLALGRRVHVLTTLVGLANSRIAVG
jgi:hypothetical protein